MQAGHRRPVSRQYPRSVSPGRRSKKETTTMPVIDADTHVDETEETWEFLNESDRRFKPITVSQQVAAEDQVPGYDRFWLVDGHLRVRRIRNDKRTGTT